MFILPKLLVRVSPLLLLLAGGAMRIQASSFQLNFLDSNNTDTVAYTGVQSNWLLSGCGSQSSLGGYYACDGDLLGDLTGSTRAGISVPNLPYGSAGTQFDIVNGSGQTIALVAIAPEDGCLNALSQEVTCGVDVSFYSSLNGGPLSSALTSAFSSIPEYSQAYATGSNQIAYSFVWSDGRTDSIDFDIATAGSATPEPSTAALAFLFLCVFRAGTQRARFTQKVGSAEIPSF